MYSQIDKNKFLTLVLLFGFISITVGFAFLASYIWSGDSGYGIVAGILAFFLSFVSGLFSYYGGAALVLTMTGAQDVTDNPNFLDLNQRVETLAIKAGIPKPKIHVIPDMALNAFATGRNLTHSHVAVTQGLLKAMTPDELEAVIAHELGHVKNFDIRLMLIVSVLAGVLTYLADFFLRGMFFGSRNSDDNKAGPIMLVIVIVLSILAPIIATMVQLAISRKREFLADATAVEITRYPQGMINALKKLRDDTLPVQRATSGNAHMFIDFPLKDAGGFLRKLFSTHPPIEDRIRALEGI